MLNEIKLHDEEERVKEEKRRKERKGGSRRRGEVWRERDWGCWWEVSQSRCNYKPHRLPVRFVFTQSPVTISASLCKVRRLPIRL